MYRKIAIVSAALATLSVAPAHALLTANTITTNTITTNALSNNALSANGVGGELGAVIAIELPAR
jgi:hypothetical protein